MFKFPWFSLILKCLKKVLLLSGLNILPDDARKRFCWGPTTGKYTGQYIVGEYTVQYIIGNYTVQYIIVVITMQYILDK